MRFREFGLTEGPMDAFYSQFMGWGKNDDTTNMTATNVGASASSNASFASNGKLPVKGPITSPFGMRARGQHDGTDFGVPVGTPVSCPDDGVVFHAGFSSTAGNMVTVNCGNVQHRFMHLSKINVKPGEQIKSGQVIGLSGNTGLSTGPHLHWEKIVAGNKVDPMKNIG